jgi:hypothetical protein
MPTDKEILKKMDELGRKLEAQAMERQVEKLRERKVRAKAIYKTPTELELAKTRARLEVTRSQLIKSYIAIDPFDIAVWLVALFFFSTVFWLPLFGGVGVVIAVMLLTTMIVRSNFIQVIAITFSIIYFILSIITGFFYNCLDVFIIIFGFNTITLLPILMSTIIFGSLVGMGVLYGTKAWFRWTIYIVPAIAFCVALFDSVITIILLGIVAPPFQMIYTFFLYLFIHWSLYLIAFWLTFAITAGSSVLFKYLFEQTRFYGLTRTNFYEL